MSGHQKIIALQPIINNSLWIFHIAKKDCSLYNKVEHLNMTFYTIIFISYSYIIRLVRYLDDEI